MVESLYHALIILIVAGSQAPNVKTNLKLTFEIGWSLCENQRTLLAFITRPDLAKIYV